MTYAYNEVTEVICPRNDNVSHTTCDTLTLQYNGRKPKISG